MVSAQLYTSDDLFAMGSDAPFELIQGELFKVSPSSTRSNRVMSFIHFSLYSYVDQQRVGEV